MSTYIPYPFYHDDMPIDISFVFGDEKPAGKHGFIRAEGRRFVFEDGTIAKFWGTCINGMACFPEHDYARKLAHRLAKVGINIVRLHQLDSEGQVPNIFAFERGKRITNAHLCDESMDRLDYFVSCLKNEGIYVYLDLLVHRKFHEEEGVENAHLFGSSPFSSFSHKLIELQKEYATELWTHFNPYTSLKYCDDPAFVLCEIANESDLFSNYRKRFPDGYIEPYRSEFIELFRKWLCEKGIERNPEEIDPFDNDDIDYVNFKSDLETRYYAEMREHLRSIGVKIPIAGTNWYRNPAHHIAQLTCDFIDNHAYLFSPATLGCWKEFERSMPNISVCRERASFLHKTACISDIDHPTYISEWCSQWPDAYRADAVLYAAAVGAFQGWSGFSIHTYSYMRKLERVNKLGEELSSPMMMGVPYRQGVYMTWNDPARFGLFYHAALIMRRGDVRESDMIYKLPVTDPLKFDLASLETQVDRHKIVSSFDESDGLEILPTETENGSASSDTGELYRDWEKNFGTIDTPMTKCAYGFLAQNGEIELDGLKIKCDTKFAVIAMSSLTKEPISSSDNILLTTVGKAMNTDAKFDGEVVVDIGHAPITVENIEVEIELSTSVKNLKVWSISAEGYYIGAIPAVESDGKLKFKLGNTARSMYYMLVKD